MPFVQKTLLEQQYILLGNYEEVATAKKSVVKLWA